MEKEYDYLYVDKLNPPNDFSNIDDVLDKTKQNEIIKFTQGMKSEIDIIKLRCDKFKEEMDTINNNLLDIKKRIESEGNK